MTMMTTTRPGPTALMERGAATELTLAPGGGILPQNLAQAMDLAVMLAASNFIPSAFQQKPGDVVAAILFGLDLGLPPMQALQCVAVVNGKPSVYGDGFLAVIYSGPYFEDHEEWYEVKGEKQESVSVADLAHDDTAAVCLFKSKRKSAPTTRRFSVGHAKKASLWGKSGPWTQYPDRMLMYRARGFAGRDTFPDRLRGVILAEEAMDVIDVTPREAGSAPMPQRASAQPKVEGIEGGRRRRAKAETNVASAEEVPASATPEPASVVEAPPQDTFPAAADRIVAVEELKTPTKVDEQTGEETGGTPYAMVTTFRGVTGYTFKQVESAKTFFASQAPCDVATDKDGAGRVRILAITPFDALGGAGR
jgi:hypothetical protein